MDAEKKAARLQLLKRVGEKHQERECALFGEIPLSRQEILETVGGMDTFREEYRSRRSECDALTSDEA